jgi:hypothetical protein
MLAGLRKKCKINVNLLLKNFNIFGSLKEMPLSLQ